MRRAELAPVDVLELREGVTGGEEDATRGNPPSPEATGDPVFARAEARSG